MEEIDGQIETKGKNIATLQAIPKNGARGVDSVTEAQQIAEDSGPEFEGLATQLKENVKNHQDALGALKTGIDRGFLVDYLHQKC